MCPLDVVFNFLLIFPTRELTLMGRTLTVPGAGLGVTGAALLTGASVRKHGTGPSSILPILLHRNGRSQRTHTQIVMPAAMSTAAGDRRFFLGNTCFLA